MPGRNSLKTASQTAAIETWSDLVQGFLDALSFCEITASGSKPVSTPQATSDERAIAAGADLDTLGEQIAELSAQIQAATYGRTRSIMGLLRRILTAH
jgi:hypothetical protein